MGKHKKPDNSPRIEQNGKIKEEIKIRPFKWTEKQQKFIDLALSKDIQIIICHGSPGTGKTLLSLYCCLELLNKKSISNIIFYRSPIESATKSLGFLSGDYNEKIAPYGEPLQDHLRELLDKVTMDFLFKDNRISIDSIGFAKGRTHNATGVILDESEDLTIQELELIMGRLGKFSKLFIIGDERQANIRNSGFRKVFDLFDDDEALKNGVTTFKFNKEDCMRNEILKFILSRFEEIN